MKKATTKKTTTQRVRKRRGSLHTDAPRPPTLYIRSKNLFTSKRAAALFSHVCIAASCPRKFIPRSSSSFQGRERKTRKAPTRWRTAPLFPPSLDKRGFFRSYCVSEILCNRDRPNCVRKEKEITSPFRGTPSAAGQRSVAGKKKAVAGKTSRGKKKGGLLLPSTSSSSSTNYYHATTFQFLSPLFFRFCRQCIFPAMPPLPPLGVRTAQFLRFSLSCFSSPMLLLALVRAQRGLAAFRPCTRSASTPFLAR